LDFYFEHEITSSFFLVGAGTAGCILAARLSEDPERTVLLLESGPEFGWLASVPLAAPILQNTVSDWAFRSVPQQASQLGLKNKVCFHSISFFKQHDFLLFLTLEIQSSAIIF
jgi:choline dehydrogenase-like flavoprotein